jgi:hypothetical protein
VMAWGQRRWAFFFFRHFVVCWQKKRRMRNFRDSRLAPSVALRCLGCHQGLAVASPPLTPVLEANPVGAPPPTHVIRGLIRLWSRHRHCTRAHGRLTWVRGRWPPPWMTSWNGTQQSTPTVCHIVAQGQHGGVAHPLSGHWAPCSCTSGGGAYGIVGSVLNEDSVTVNMLLVLQYWCS